MGGSPRSPSWLTASAGSPWFPGTSKMFCVASAGSIRSFGNVKSKCLIWSAHKTKSSDVLRRAGEHLFLRDSKPQLRGLFWPPLCLRCSGNILTGSGPQLSSTSPHSLTTASLGPLICSQGFTPPPAPALKTWGVPGSREQALTRLGHSCALDTVLSTVRKWAHFLLPVIPTRGQSGKLRP